jgi:hypothetical protein
MTKQMLLKKIHNIIWRGNDRIGQEDLFELQALIDEELCMEHNRSRRRAEAAHIKKKVTITLKRGMMWTG